MRDPVSLILLEGYWTCTSLQRTLHEFSNFRVLIETKWLAYFFPPSSGTREISIWVPIPCFNVLKWSGKRCSVLDQSRNCIDRKLLDSSVCWWIGCEGEEKKGVKNDCKNFGLISWEGEGPTSWDKEGCRLKMCLRGDEESISGYFPFGIHMEIPSSQLDIWVRRAVESFGVEIQHWSHWHWDGL